MVAAEYENQKEITKMEFDDFFFQAEDGIRDKLVTGVQTCALPILDLGLADARGGEGRQGRDPPAHRAARRRRRGRPDDLLGDARDSRHEPPHHGDARGARDRNPGARAGGPGEDHGARRALGATARQSMPQALTQRTVDARAPRRARGLPPEASILMVLIGLALTFELLGWILVRQSFLLNEQRLVVMILQVSVIGIIAVGVTQVIITAGIDLSSGSVVAVTAMVAASLAQSSDAVRAVYPSLTDLPVLAPVMAGLAVGAAAGLANGALVAYTSIPPFIATLGVMVSARGIAKWYTHGQPVSILTDAYSDIGGGAVPVMIFLGTALIFHIALRYTRYGKFTYAIGANPQAAR